MSKLYKFLLAALVVSTFSFTAAGQASYWSAHSESARVTTDKAVARVSFPKEFKLYDLNIAPLRDVLFSITDNSARPSTVITLPDADGRMEQFQVWEASNFEPALQARFPEIRAFSGRSLRNGAEMLKISISPQGIQTMVFRADGPNEYMEPYSEDHTVYAVFKSQRQKGGLPWVCSTPDQQLAAGLQQRVGRIESNAGELKTLRLAQSVTAEYSNWFGATSSAQVALVLAAINTTLTRTNGCYEKDLAIHLNLIATTTNVIYYDPNTDPYSPAATGAAGAWNNELQTTLTNVIGAPNYDIGHLFGASGGGGNAGCIGCVCVDATKGRGFTSPADAIPQGDNFDIDYVAHEIGHQLGGNHTFSMSNEGTGVNKEVGSGITIMGYAGITSQDVAPHSIDIFHEATIQQIQVNMATKSCPVTTSLSGINATPMVNALTNYTIPISTPFQLTGSATDADAGDVLTYCWEQNDDGTGQTGNNSVAYQAKPTGPNWLSFPATTTPTRLMPRLSTILTGANLTGPLPGGDAIANIEALSNVGRTLNFRLTVRDNRPYNGTAVGQTNFQDMVVTVNAATGPFLITTQNTATSWTVGSTQTISWSVNGTTGAPINCANVKISLSTDGGVTFPTVIAASTANDGTEDIVVPNAVTSTARIKVEAIGNIFFDINNANITIAPPPNGFTFNSPAAVTASCPATDVMTSGNLTASWTGTFTGDVSLTGVVSPAGPVVSFASTTLTQASPSTTVSLTGMSTLAPGNYTVTVTGTGTGAPTMTRDIVFTINPGAGPSITTQPANQTACAGTNATFSVVSTGTYQWQLSTNGGTSWTNIAGATATSYTVTGVTTAQNSYQYRVIVSGQCGSTTSSAATLTVNVAPAVTGQPTSLSLCSGSAASFSVTATGNGLSYQWQLSTDGGTTWNNISGATSSTYNIASVAVTDNNNQYRCVVTGSCTPAATSNAATLSVSQSITISTNPTNQTVCEATNITFNVAAQGSGLSYQWQVSTDGGTTWTNLANTGNYSGATTTALTITGVLPSQNNYRFRAIASNSACNPGTSTAATLTVNTFPVISTQPASATICAGAAQTFSVTATTGVGTLTYQWQLSVNGGSTWTNITGATSASFAQAAVPVGQNGYRFRVIVTAGCGSVTSNAAVLTVNAYPEVSFTLPAVTCVSDPAFSLSASPVGGTFSGNGVSGTTFTPSIAGVGAKQVTYTISNGTCQTATARTILVNACTERHITLDKYSSVTVYPNPNNGAFRIRLNSDLYSKLNVRIYNANGQLVKAQVNAGLTYGSVVSIDLGTLPGGVYHLYLSNDENGFVKRSSSFVVYR